MEGIRERSETAGARTPARPHRVQAAEQASRLQATEALRVLLLHVSEQGSSLSSLQRLWASSGYPMPAKRSPRQCNDCGAH